MLFPKQNKSFVSEIDIFLAEFDKQHPHRSKSQQQEIEKYRRIYALRDNPAPQPKKDDVWEEF